MCVGFSSRKLFVVIFLFGVCYCLIGILGEVY